VLRQTTSRGLCGLGCPSRTSERGGEGDCVKEGGGGEGKCERERALDYDTTHIEVVNAAALRLLIHSSDLYRSIVRQFCRAAGSGVRVRPMVLEEEKK
jgi:hypothetical protein